MHNVTTVRVTKPDIMQASMTMLTEDAKPQGKVIGAYFAPGKGQPFEAAAVAYLINHNADHTLATFRFRLKDIKMFAAEDSFKDGDRAFNAGSFIIKSDGNPSDLRSRLETAASATGITAIAAAAVPNVPMHELAAPRIALVHTWTNTQNEGWYRVAFDQTHIPYDYISDQKLKEITDLRAKYDVILFAPVGGTAQRIVNGAPDRKSTRLNSSHLVISYAVFCLKKKNI